MTCDWGCGGNWVRGGQGQNPRFWAEVCHRGCHYVVDFNLRLATLVEPDRPWRILTSEKHSTVWDGGDLLLDLNFLAFGIPADEAYELATPVGEYLRGGHVGKIEEWIKENYPEDREGVVFSHAFSPSVPRRQRCCCAELRLAPEIHSNDLRRA